MMPHTLTNDIPQNDTQQDDIHPFNNQYTDPQHNTNVVQNTTVSIFSMNVSI
jgi:hypothetical protein